jgi:hypothetical protein
MRIRHPDAVFGDGGYLAEIQEAAKEGVGRRYWGRRTAKF